VIQGRPHTDDEVGENHEEVGWDMRQVKDQQRLQRTIEHVDGNSCEFNLAKLAALAEDKLEGQRDVQVKWKAWIHLDACT